VEEDALLSCAVDVLLLSVAAPPSVLSVLLDALLPFSLDDEAGAAPLEPLRS